MLNWKKYVDHIYILTCTKRKDYIYNHFLNELRRIHIDINDIDFVTIFTNISTPIYDSIYNNYFERYTEVTSTRGYALECALGHYYLMKLAEYNNYERILILEDDNCFLKDNILIENILDKINDEFNSNNLDVCLLGQCKYSDNENDYINYINLYDTLVVGAVCNMYNKKAYTSVINLIENEKISFAFDEYNYIWDKSLKFGDLNISIASAIGIEILNFNTIQYYNYIRFSHENIINYYKLLINGYWVIGKTKNELLSNFCKYIEYYNIIDEFRDEYNIIKQLITTDDRI